MGRISDRFAALKKEGRAAFIPFVMAGDPGYDASLELIKKLPEAGADLIELGVAFTDPMADGPAIQAAGLRALDNGQTLKKTLQMVRSFREQDNKTPIILMGYFNPFYIYGVDAFLTDAFEAGVDGLIVVDLPPEEDSELCLPAREAGLDFIRLATPTTDSERLPAVARHASGFIYYVSVAGVTGGAAGQSTDIEAAAQRLKDASGLPVAVGFGIKTPEQAREIAKFSDAAVVGSALVTEIETVLSDPAIENQGNEADIAINAVLKRARDIGAAVHGVRRM